MFRNKGSFNENKGIMSQIIFKKKFFFDNLRFETCAFGKCGLV